MVKRSLRGRSAAVVAAISLVGPLGAGILASGGVVTAAGSTSGATIPAVVAAGVDSDAAFSVPTTVGSTRPTSATPTPALGRETVLLNDGTATEVLDGSGDLTLYARGTQCAGAPTLAISVDGTSLGNTTAKGVTYFWNYTYPAGLKAGAHTVSVAFTNAYSSAACQRSLILGWAALSSPAAPTDPANPSGQAMPTGDLPGWKQDMAEDFTGTAVNTNNWSMYTGSSKANPNTHWRAQNDVVSGGELDLGAYQDPATGNWTSGGISSGKSVSQTYGMYEVRARSDRAADIPFVALLWPTKGWPPEIDFAEDDNGARSKLTSTLHYSSSNKMIHNSAAVDMTQWHTYGVIWTPGEIEYTLDGAVWAQIASSSVPSQPMVLDLQTEIGNCSAAGSCTVPGQSMANTDIDWVVQYSYQG